MSPCDCKKEKCKSKATLHGTFVGFTATMSATGAGSTNCLAQDEAQKHVEETLKQYLVKNPSVILTDYYIEYTNKCNGKVITEPCFRPDDKYKVTFKAYKKINAVTATLPDITENGSSALVTHVAEYYNDDRFTGVGMAVATESHDIISHHGAEASVAAPAYASNIKFNTGAFNEPAEFVAESKNNRTWEITKSTAFIEGQNTVGFSDYNLSVGYIVTEGTTTVTGRVIVPSGVSIGVLYGTLKDRKIESQPKNKSSNGKQVALTYVVETTFEDVSADIRRCRSYGSNGQFTCPP